MVFSSILFLFYFLPTILTVYFIAPKKHRNLVLFLGSLFFYAWGEPVYVLLMLFSTVFNYFISLKIASTDNKGNKKKLLLLSVILNIGMLVFFKYTNFFVDILNATLPVSIPHVNLALPIGISFYTFQIMSYVIDVYRKKVAVQKNYIHFGTYVALFPQLIAGPIVRYSDIEKQLTKRRETARGFAEGIVKFSVGLGKKVLLANNIGVLWDTIHTTALSELSVLASWLGIIAFAFQIYFDFSGYSDMAIGLGKMMGFTFEKNFDYPYTSKSITEFWRRWHISLGTWFKEYVYIPLGGNRVGKARAHLNILIVWALTGFWHGASFNFLLWGIYYGVLLILEKNFLKGVLNKLPKALQILYTMFFVLIGWVLFATDNLKEAVLYLGAMFGICGKGFYAPSFLYELLSNKVLLIAGALGASSYPLKFAKKYITPKPMRVLVCVALLILLCVAYLVDSAYNPFLYFRF